jgi:hypothetical protein
VLDQIMNREMGDIAVDGADERPPYHPHHSAPYLKTLLREDGFAIDDMTTITVIRHPVHMLWSYYKFFRPDAQSSYNYSPKYDASHRMSFEDWILNGRVGMDTVAKSLAPRWISTGDLSPLSLEAHANRADGVREVDRVFRIEAVDDLVTWLRQRTGRAIKMVHVNASEAMDLPTIGPAAISKIRAMFPEESGLYQV